MAHTQPTTDLVTSHMNINELRRRVRENSHRQYWVSLGSYDD